jgi:transcription antitermination factor NusG
MSYWACAQLEMHRERLALHFLGLNRFPTYCPRIRIQRPSREGEHSTWLFPGYTFVWIQLQWHAARWAPGVVRLVSSGSAPAKVPMSVIDDLKSREVNGYVVLPQAQGLKPGDRVRVVRGLLQGQIGLVAGMQPRQRVEVLLTLLGASRSVVLPKGDIEEAV